MHVCVCLYQNIEKHTKVSFMYNSLGESYAFLQLISLWKDEVHTIFLRLLCSSDSSVNKVLPEANPFLPFFQIDFTG